MFSSSVVNIKKEFTILSRYSDFNILLLSYKGGHQNPENLSNLAKIPQLVRRKLRLKSRIQVKAHRQHSLGA